MSAFNAAVQTRLSDTVWNAGCTNWYTTEDGKQTNNWPHFTVEYWWRTLRPRLDDFEWQISPRTAPGEHVAADPRARAAE